MSRNGRWSTSSLRPAGELHDREDGDGGGDGEQDRPAEVAPAWAVERRQRERAQRPGGGAEARERPEPDEDQRADAGGQESGQEHERQGRLRRAPSPRSISTAPITGEPKIDETAAKLPAAAIRPTACSGASRLTSRIASVPSPSPTAIRGPSGPSTSPSPSVASAASSTPGRSIGASRRATGLEPVGGHMTAVSGQTHDGERRQQPRERHPRKRPPERDRVVAESCGQILVDPHLELVNALQEAPRRGRDHQPDQRREHEQHAVLPAADQRSRIVGREGTAHDRRSLEVRRKCGDPCRTVARPPLSPGY